MYLYSDANSIIPNHIYLNNTTSPIELISELPRIIEEEREKERETFLDIFS